MKNHKIKNKGFTLIELMVVIGIIALISSVVLSSLTQAKAQADNTKQIADYKVVLNALLQFKQDNGYYPYTNIEDYYTCIGSYSDNNCIVTNATVSNNIDINNSLNKYISSYKFLDKSVPITYSSGPIALTKNYKGFVVHCIEDDGSRCQKGLLFFPALKNKNSCPKIMSDIKTSDNVVTGIADYTWCKVELN
jgi:prepilin-type N-terminal cleavage/methylation domain-containing protein